MEKERLKELLKKALEHTLFDAESFGADAEPIKKSYCSTFLGMTEQEYNEIMGCNMDYRQMAVINERKLRAENYDLKQKCERLDNLLNNVCAYLVEIMHEDDMTAEHSKMAFDMNEEEHKKYILGV